MTKGKKDYYTNKILYALQKIDYAKSRMNPKYKKEQLATVYFVLQNYKNIDFKTLMRVTKLTRDQVIKALKIIEELGIATWDGKYFREKLNIRLMKPDEKPTTKEFILDLQRKMDLLEKKKLIDDKIQIVDEIDEKQTKRKSEINPQLIGVVPDEWVEINWSEDVIIKAKKRKLAELFVGDNK